VEKGNKTAKNVEKVKKQRKSGKITKNGGGGVTKMILNRNKNVANG